MNIIFRKSSIVARIDRFKNWFWVPLSDFRSYIDREIVSISGRMRLLVHKWFWFRFILHYYRKVHVITRTRTSLHLLWWTFHPNLFLQFIWTHNTLTLSHLCYAINQNNFSSFITRCVCVLMHVLMFHWRTADEHSSRLKSETHSFLQCFNHDRFYELPIKVFYVCSCFFSLNWTKNAIHDLGMQLRPVRFALEYSFFLFGSRLFQRKNLIMIRMFNIVLISHSQFSFALLHDIHLYDIYSSYFSW